MTNILNLDVGKFVANIGQFRTGIGFFTKILSENVQEAPIQLYALPYSASSERTWSYVVAYIQIQRNSLTKNKVQKFVLCEMPPFN